MQPSAADIAAVAQHNNPGAPAPQAQPAPSQPAPQMAPPAVQPPVPPSYPSQQVPAQQPQQPAPQAPVPFVPGIQTMPPQPAQPQQPVAPPATAPAPGQPAPQPGQPQQQPADPFAALMAQFGTQPQPGQPGAPQQQPAPQPQPQPQPAPGTVVEPGQPQQQPGQPAPQPAPQPGQPAQRLNYGDFLDQRVGELQPVQYPDMSQVDGTDEAAVKQFFTDFSAAVQRETLNKVERQNTIQTIERQGWDDAFGKYGTLKTNKRIRDMVQAVRVQQYQQGNPLSPTEAADFVLQGMGAEYQRGIADGQQTTQYLAAQPPTQFGGGQAAPQIPDPQGDLLRVQTGGETELASILAARMQAGTLPG